MPSRKITAERAKNADNALFAVTVDENGLLIEGTGAFSSCAWATGRLERLRRGDPAALDGFETVATSCEEAMTRLLDRPVPYPSLLPCRSGASAEGGWRATVTDLVGGAAAGAATAAISALAPVFGGAVGAGAVAGLAGSAISRVTKRAEQAEPQPEPGQQQPGQQPSDRRSLQVLDVVALAAVLADILQLPPGMCDLLQVRVKSYPVGRKKDGSLPDAEPVFLSSLIAPDLARVAGAATDGLGPALTSYLSDPLPARKRVDLRENRSLLLDGVRPDSFPPARWPADIGKKLAVSQQFAVNMIMSELADGGLFAVNGPPGTGKTTMLRDLVAAVVVRRAVELARLSRAQDAFTTRVTWRGSTGKKLVLRGPRKELTGFEIIVASSNNAAVENVRCPQVSGQGSNRIFAGRDGGSYAGGQHS